MEKNDKQDGDASLVSSSGMRDRSRLVAGSLNSGFSEVALVIAANRRN
jgi:hypothetical protein